MKKNKIIGIAVASFGVLACAGSAFALYKTGARDTGFGIGAGSYEGQPGTITYKIAGHINGTIAPQYWNQDGSDKTGTGLTPVYKQVVYEAPLSADFANDLNRQNFVVGNLQVKVENIPEVYQGKLAIWVDVQGYEADSLGAHYYGTLINEDYAITNENQSFNVNKNIAVAASGTQSVRIILKYTLGEYDLLTKNEASLGYSLSIKWGAPNNEFGNCYVLGNGTRWEFDDKFAMAPNINKPYDQGWEWVYNNLPGSDLEEAKCAKPGQGDEKIYCANGENVALDAQKVYDVYWNGENSGEAHFYEQQAQQQQQSSQPQQSSEPQQNP